METKGLTIEELLVYCKAAKEVFKYYDSNVFLTPEIAQSNIAKRNKAADRYYAFIKGIEEKLDIDFDEEDD